MNDALDDLIQRTLDGEASEQEQTRLEAQMAGDPAARARFDELSAVFRVLRAAHLEDAPAGLRDEVLRSIRGAAPAWAKASARAGRPATAERARPVLAGRPAFSWLRIALPAAAGVLAALVLVANWQGGPWRPAEERVTGSMSGPASTDAMRLGAGTSAVLVRWAPSAQGFQLRIQSGDAPVRVVLEALSAGTSLSLGASPGSPSPGASTPSPRLEATLPANALVVAEGTAPDTQATVRVSVTLPDGRSVTGRVNLRGLRPS